MLLDAVYKQRGMKVHTHLNRMGLSDTKLFHEWRVKSLTYTSKANAMVGGYALALDLAKRGIMLTAGIDSLQAQDKNFKKLMVDCKQRIDQAKKKEKKAARAMFGGSPKKDKKSNRVKEEKKVGGGREDKKAKVRLERSEATARAINCIPALLTNLYSSPSL